MEEDARRRTGLIIGKFLPPHAGHLHLIRQALERVDELTVAVCSIGREPIPGEQRVAWMRELVPEATVVHITDENPQYPHEHPDFWEIWTASIRRVLPAGPDVVFTSEDYGDELARRLGARHVLVDPGRLEFPVSGTAIRERPFEHWDFIPPIVRPWFVKRIVLTGSECTGKTTLARRLAEKFGTVWSEEYGRIYVDRKGSFVTEEDVVPIAEGQVRLEERARRDANRLVFHDTDLLSTVIYARHYFGSCPPEVEAMLEARPADLYLLCAIDVPWVADGAQRDRGDRREEMQSLFREALVSRRLPFVEVSGSVEERISAVEKAL
jgi:HTH-type transcriptional repressor of NAD biosynthesis genes